MTEVEENLELFAGGKKVTKCFRFPSQAIRELESEATRKAISLNSLMSILVMSYLEWGRFVEHYGGLSFSQTSFSAFTKEIDLSLFEKTGKEAGSKTPRRLLLTLGLPCNKENVLRLVNIICKHSMSYRFDHRIIDKKHHFLITHELGEKWSKWFASYLKSMFKDLLEIDVQIQEDEDSVSFVV
jgi:hypothetical protein